MGSKITGALKDLAISVVVGIAVSAVITGIAALIGIFAGMAASLDVARRILFIVGALGMILIAVAILARGKKPQFGDVKDMTAWRKRFSVMHLPDVIGVIGIVMIACGCVVETIARSLAG